jgi:hypothetical protein
MQHVARGPCRRKCRCGPLSVHRAPKETVAPQHKEARSERPIQGEARPRPRRTRAGAVAVTTPVISLDWPVITGSGFVVTVLFLALVERLRRTFASQSDLNGVGERVNALQTLVIQLREGLDENRERVVAVETEQKHQWERVAEQVIRPLERITEKLETVTEAQAAQAAALEHIGRWLDRINDARTSRKP